MKRQGNLMHVVHFLSSMKHVRKVSKAEFSSEILLAQSPLNLSIFWKIVTTESGLWEDPLKITNLVQVK